VSLSAGSNTIRTISTLFLESHRPRAPFELSLVFTQKRVNHSRHPMVSENSTPRAVSLSAGSNMIRTISTLSLESHRPRATFELSRVFTLKRVNHSRHPTVSQNSTPPAVSLSAGSVSTSVGAFRVRRWRERRGECVDDAVRCLRLSNESRTAFLFLL
jgi:hypothetical protein